jgi:threonine dehydrogenase-like Zn-dependent dehydrogenase
MTVLAAKHLGAETLFAIDIVPERLALAEKFGATPLNPSLINVKEMVLNSTNGRGADGVMEAVGSEQSLKLAIEILRPGGIISSAGVHTAEHFSFSPGEAYDKNLNYKTGRCPARFYSERLLKEEIPQRYAIEDIITHQFPLQQGASAYEFFDKKLDNCIKAVLLT